MDFVCDAPEGRTWFRIETEAEALHESELMGHAVARHFSRERDRTAAAYQPTSQRVIEQNIGLEPYIRRTMPWFLTLRDREGGGLATAMLPPGGRDDPGFRIIIVGKDNTDPYPEHRDAIEALGRHLGIKLGRARCYPYRG